MSKGILFITILCSVLMACTKQVAKNPSLAYSDLALLDSCEASYHTYYKNDKTIHSLAPGSNSPHGPFQLRFNAVAFKMLSDSGRLPLKGVMPEGAMVIKDVYKDGKLDVYALMYKHKGVWLWAELAPGKRVIYSVNKDPGLCISCHSQQGNRDLLRSFTFY